MKLTSNWALSLILFFCATSTFAGNYQDLDALKTSVAGAVHQHLVEIFGTEQVDRDMKIQVSALDARLRVAACAHKPTVEVQQASYGGRNFAARVSCMEGAQWTLYVPVSVDVYGDVVIANRDIARGEILQAQDLNTQRINVSNLSMSYSTEPSSLVGKEVKRTLPAGTPIRVGDLREPDIIKKGDRVKVVYRGDNLLVSSVGTAMANGTMGTSIRILNTKSQRVIDARVTGPGEAEVQ